MKETTSRFPDLVKIIKDSCKPEASTFILDAEVVLSVKPYFSDKIIFSLLYLLLDIDSLH